MHTCKPSTPGGRGKRTDYKCEPSLGNLIRFLSQKQKIKTGLGMLLSVKTLDSVPSTPNKTKQINQGSLSLRS